MNYIVSSIFTTCNDPQRNIKWEPSFDIVKDWWESGTAVCKADGDTRLIIFYDDLPEDVLQKLANEYTLLIKVDACNEIPPYEYRWLIYNTFIQETSLPINYIFFTDISDVIIKNSPFKHLQEDTLYGGDETEPLGCGWIVSRINYYVENIQGFKEVFEEHIGKALLNCGIIGGSFTVMQSFLQKLAFFTESTLDKPTWITDMVNHNYIIRKYFDKVVHGAPVNSIFKKFELDREDVWFIHK